MTLSAKDRSVIRAFTEQRTARGDKLSTDGSRLNGSWMGGGKIAWWSSDGIHFGDLGSRSAQSVQNLVRNEAVPNTLPSTVVVRDKTSGGTVHLTVRRGVVVGAGGSDPSRFVGRTVEEAKLIAKSSASSRIVREGKKRVTSALGSKTVIRVGKRCCKV